MHSVQAYPLGGTELEEQRLVKQAIDHEPRTRLLLGRVGVRPGWRVADIGCGPLGILPALAECVGPTGRVVGVERERRFAEAARAQIVQRGLQNVMVVESDALEPSLEKESFDLVHERLVAINVSARQTLLGKMLSLLRPGGIAVLQDVDNVSWLCEPSHPSWDALLTAFHAVEGHHLIGLAYRVDGAFGFRTVGVAEDLGIIGRRRCRATREQYQTQHKSKLIFPSVRHRQLLLCCVTHGR